MNVYNPTTLLPHAICPEARLHTGALDVCQGSDVGGPQNTLLYEALLLNQD